MKSCRTRDFCLSIHFVVPQAFSGLKAALSGLISALSNLGSAKVDLGLRGQVSGLSKQIKCLRGQISGLRGQISGLRGPGGLTDRRTDERTDEQKSPCVLQDFVPFGAAALLPLIPIYNHSKQGNGYR